MEDSPERSTESGWARPWHTIILAAIGAYANAVAYGFSFGGGNHEFELPLLNWLHDPGLYPHDPIRDAFSRFPTVFWPIVAYFSRWMSIEKVVFLFFVLTKALFFLALAFILGSRVKGAAIRACIILPVALSPFLNDLTPLGASDILDSTQTQTSLAIALLLWAAWCLLERRWMAASVICALTIYIGALFFVFMLFPFVIFAVLDWRQNKKEILRAGLLGAAISAPWFLFFPGVSYSEFPKGYVEALLAFYPFHLTLGSHEAYEIVCGVGILVAAALIIIMARKFARPGDFRLEILTASFLAPVFLGAVFGAWHLTPTLARLQLLRADSFLILYSTLLLQIYGANFLDTGSRGPATTYLLCSVAILLPLSNDLGLLWLLFIVMLLWADPKERFENFWRTMARLRMVRGIGVFLLLGGAAAAWITRAEWSLTVVIALALLAGCFLACDERSPASAERVTRTALAVCSASVLVVMVSTVPNFSRIWNPRVSPTPAESDWRAIQEWAKLNAPQDAQFLVPTYPGGFREFSERSSWGEWKDGQSMYLCPAFADEYRRRMEAVGYSWDKWRGTESISGNYKRLSWERLSELARQNQLSYIIQFREVAYPAAPVFANQHYAVYKVVF